MTGRETELGKETLEFHRLYHEKISRRLRTVHIGSMPQAEFLTLCIVAQSEGMSMNELAQRSASHKQRLTVLVNRLEEKGYLRRERSSADRRVVRLFLTGQAHSLMADAQRQTEQDLARVFTQLDDSTMAEYLDALRRLNAVLNRFPATKEDEVREGEEGR